MHTVDILEPDFDGPTLGTKLFHDVEIVVTDTSHQPTSVPRSGLQQGVEMIEVHFAPQERWQM